MYSFSSLAILCKNWSLTLGYFKNGTRIHILFNSIYCVPTLLGTKFMRLFMDIFSTLCFLLWPLRNEWVIQTWTVSCSSIFRIEKLEMCIFEYLRPIIYASICLSSKMKFWCFHLLRKTYLQFTLKNLSSMYFAANIPKTVFRVSTFYDESSSHCSLAEISFEFVIIFFVIKLATP